MKLNLKKFFFFKLFDLFTLKDSDNKSSPKNTGSNSSVKVPGIPMKSLLENFPELWEQQQYEKEFDLTTFVSNLNKNH